MGRLHANRTLAGNIALVLFLAFLVTLTFGIGSPAMADTTSASFGLGGGNSGTATVQVERQDSGRGDNVKFTLTLGVTTDFQNWPLKILLGYSSSTISHEVYNGNVSSQVYNQVYQYVYDWVYSMPYDVEKAVYFLVYLGGENNQQSVALDITVPPKVTGGGGGGGGATTPTSTTTTQTAVSGGNLVAGGTQTATVSGGQGTVEFKVDASSVASQITQSGVTQVVLAAPTQVTVNGTTAPVAEAAITVPADTLNKVFTAGKPVVIQAAGVTLELPPAAFDVASMAGQNVNLTFSVKQVDASSAPAPGSTLYKIAGKVYEIAIRATSGSSDVGGVERMAKKVTLTLPYDPSVDGVKSIARLTNGTWQDLGGTVDAANHTVTVLRDSLSQYTVLAYTGVFKDMVGHWAEADVNLMAKKGIAKGMASGTFAPDATITRAQFAAFLIRAMGISEAAATGTKFTDVKADAWYAGAVETAAKAGLVSGYPDRTFRPNAPITRQELAVMVARAMGKSNLSDSEIASALAAFSDRSDIAAWAKAGMAAAVSSGIVQGRTATTCAPKATGTRAEALVMLKRFMSATGRL